MNATREKRIQLSDHTARHLEQLARAEGTTESALIERALDLLFQERNAPPIPASLQADWELLQQLEAELGTPAPRPKFHLDPAEIVSFVGTPIPPGTVRHFDK